MGDRLMMTLTMRTTAMVLCLSMVMRVGGRGYESPRRVVSIQWQEDGCCAGALVQHREEEDQDSYCVLKIRLCHGFLGYSVPKTVTYQRRGGESNTISSEFHTLLGHQNLRYMQFRKFVKCNMTFYFFLMNL